MVGVIRRGGSKLSLDQERKPPGGVDAVARVERLAEGIGRTAQHDAQRFRAGLSLELGQGERCRWSQPGRRLGRRRS